MTEWSVLLKVGLADGEIPRARIDELLSLLPGKDKGATGGDGPDITVTFWVPATDAAQAVLAGWERLEAARHRLGLGPWTAVRTHAASAAQRLTGFEGVEPRVTDRSAWSVLLKSMRGPDGAEADPSALARIAGRLGLDATVGGSAGALVARFWVAAAGAAEADAAARTALEAATAAEGLRGWAIVRAHHAVAGERAEEIYRGAAERAARAVVR
jgi:hypothetical protein